MREYVDNKVYELRKKREITQEQFAADIGITRQTVIAIEKKNYTPSVLLAFKIARYFKLRVDDVFRYIHEK